MSSRVTTSELAQRDWNRTAEAGPRRHLGGRSAHRAASDFRLRAAQPCRSRLGTGDRGALDLGQRTRRNRQRPGAGLYDHGKGGCLLRLALQLLRPTCGCASEAAAAGCEDSNRSPAGPHHRRDPLPGARALRRRPARGLLLRTGAFYLFNVGRIDAGDDSVKFSSVQRCGGHSDVSCRYPRSAGICGAFSRVRHRLCRGLEADL